jgi:hypothetical protein
MAGAIGYAKKGTSKAFSSQKPKYSDKENKAFEQGAKDISWGKSTKKSKW